jgi:hypothetical protein
MLQIVHERYCLRRRVTCDILSDVRYRAQNIFSSIMSDDKTGSRAVHASEHPAVCAIAACSKTVRSNRKWEDEEPRGSLIKMR